MNLDNFFKPKSVAIIGASRSPNKVGNVILKNLIESGYPGEIYPINPNTEEILNKKSYSSLLKVKEKISLAIISVPQELVMKSLRDCKKKKVKDVLVITAGYSEIGNKKAEQELKNFIKKNKMNMIGPNCVSAETPILFTNDNHTKYSAIGDMINNYMEKNKSKVINFSGTKILDTSYLDKELKVASFYKGKHCYKKITKLMKRKRCKDAYKVKLESGREIITSQDHPFIIKEKNGLVKKPLKEIKIGDLVPITVDIEPSRDYINEINLLNSFKEIPYEIRKNLRFYYRHKSRDEEEIKNLSHKELREVKIIATGKVSLPLILPITKELCEIIGNFIADGSYKDKACSIGYIEDPVAETKIRDNINKVFSSKLSLKPRKEIKFGGVVGKSIFKYVFKIGNGIKNKKIPDIIFSTSKENIVAFLGGLYDGDGGIHIYKNKPKASLYMNTVSEKIKDQTLALLSLIDVGPFYYQKVKKEGKPGVYNNAKDQYDIRSDSKQTIADLYEKGFRFLGVKNKKLSYVVKNRYKFKRHSKGNLLLRKIKSIEKIEAPIDLYDFEVEDSHTFFAGQVLTSNCLGTLDTYHQFDNLFLPNDRLERPSPGPISFVCQSGAVGSAILDLATGKKHKFSKFISYGNATTIDESDIIEYLSKDKTTKVICAYIEGIKDGEKFFKIAKKVSKKKPIIVYKGGLTEEGSKAAISHTGSLAGKKEVYFGIFKQTGIIKASSLEEMFDIASLIEENTKLKGNKIQIITNGGGYGIITTDNIAESKNLKMANLSNFTIRKLKSKLPSTINIHNPLDLVGDATNERYELAIKECIRDKNINALIVIALIQTPGINKDLNKIILKYKKKTTKPIIVVATGSEPTEEFLESLEDLDIVNYNFPENAVKSLDLLYYYEKKKKTL